MFLIEGTIKGLVAEIMEDGGFAPKVHLRSFKFGHKEDVPARKSKTGQRAYSLSLVESHEICRHRTRLR